jgi:hypothetical protein
VFLVDGDQLLLEAVGSGLVILGVSAQVGGDGLDQIVGERECRFGNKGRQSLGELFQGPGEAGESAWGTASTGHGGVEDVRRVCILRGSAHLRGHRIALITAW